MASKVSRLTGLAMVSEAEGSNNGWLDVGFIKHHRKHLVVLFDKKPVSDVLRVNRERGCVVRLIEPHREQVLFGDVKVDWKP